MTTVRMHTPADAEWIVSAARDFYTTSFGSRILGPFSERKIRAMIENSHKGAPLGVIIAERAGAPVGCLAIVVFPAPFTESVLACELFYAVTERKRQRRGAIARALLNAGVEFSKMAKADKMIMMAVKRDALSGEEMRRVGEFYQKNDFSCYQTHYIRELANGS